MNLKKIKSKNKWIILSQRKKFSKKLDDFFGIKKSGSEIKIEIFAGLATFLAMAYILTVNPNNILFGGQSDPR